MDITKKLYILAILLVGILGFFTYRETSSGAVQDDTALKNAQMNAAVRRMLKDLPADSESGSFMSQLPEMRVAEKYRAVQEDEAKSFNLKRLGGGNTVSVDSDMTDGSDYSLQERNERIKNVEETLAKLQQNTLPPLPAGFFLGTANPYVMYREYQPLTDDFKGLILGLHGRLIKSVTPFSIITIVDRIFMMMFRTRENYSLYANRPGWSAGATDVMDDSIYIMENHNFKSTFMHELTHIYFDGYFKPSVAPRWLSEGFAVYIQSLYQTPAENEWLNNFSRKFAGEEYIDFEQFTGVDNLSGYDNDAAGMWYAQSYSVVRFLFERYGPDDYYQFSKNMKSGMPLNSAMFRAYGMPLNSVKALEYAWQANLQRKF